MLTKQCAWCGKTTEYIDSKQTGVTHGICPDCYTKEMRKIQKKEVK